jgi:hypothetical protein
MRRRYCCLGVGAGVGVDDLPQERGKQALGANGLETRNRYGHV